MRDQDILLSKDSNVGECAIVDGDNWKHHTFSGGIVRLNPSFDRYYLFSFLKHELFRTQILAKIPRGATIKHAKGLWLDCLIPFPNQGDADRVVRYVSVIMQAIVDKEKEIKAKHDRMTQSIEQELFNNQDPTATFTYHEPTIHEIRKLGRLDASMYAQDFKSKYFRVTNYRHGYTAYKDLGFSVGRGQNLQISSIGKSVYSEIEKPNFYRLMLPKHITEYGTVSRYQWLGNKRDLATLSKGDVVFGGEATFRCIVICDSAQAVPTISNIHAIILRSTSIPMYRKVFIGAWLRFLGRWGFSRAMAVGGQGGSLAIKYFQQLIFPDFPSEKQVEIAELYHNPSPPPGTSLTLTNFVDWHRQWNTNLSIWELDHEMKILQQLLADVQERIIQGQEVRVPL
ncbi:MAG: hypothetical protein WKF28_07220 [Rubrobacteraceae bacterium]